MDLAQLREVVDYGTQPPEEFSWTAVNLWLNCVALVRGPNQDKQPRELLPPEKELSSDVIDKLAQDVQTTMVFLDYERSDIPTVVAILSPAAEEKKQVIPDARMDDFSRLGKPTMRYANLEISGLKNSLWC